MKKRIILIILLLVPFIVKAEDYEKFFETPQVYSYSQYNYFYKGGYVFVDIDGNSSNGENGAALLTYYDKDGNYVSSKEYDTGFYKLFSDGENLYGFIYREEQEKVVKYDDNFNIIKTFTKNDLGSEYQNYELFNKMFFYKDKILLLLEKFDPSISDYVSIIAELDKNLENDNIILDPEDEAMNVLRDEFPIYDFGPQVDFKSLSAATIGDYQYIIGAEREDCPDTFCKAHAFIIKIDKNSNLIWKKDFPKYYNFAEMAYNSKNLYIVGDIAVGPTGGREIIVMDYDGNIVRLLEEGSVTGGINVTDDKLIVSTGSYLRCLGSSFYEEENVCRMPTKHVVYKIIYNIESKVEGKGKIEVISTSPSGEGVTFKVTPEEGYVLSVVKVTDKNGNVLTFHDYTFTMPSADVLIEAIFVPKNPDTGVFISISIVAMGIISLLAMYILLKNRHEFKK